MDRTGSVPILPVKQTVTIGIMLYFDGDGHRDGDGDGTYKQALRRVYTKRKRTTMQAMSLSGEFLKDLFSEVEREVGIHTYYLVHFCVD